MGQKNRRAVEKRRRTSTSAFGVGRRESHDASAFYSRFTLPSISDDDHVDCTPAEALDRIYEADSRDMSEIASNSVALVVTSPPYFAGKEYEQAVGEGHVPGSYVEYLDLLCEVFAECRRVLEAGGRIAVNVANLGRKPYRSLSADIIDILQNRLGLLLRGEIIWVKGEAASGSCAWGSFRSPTNPVLRDLTERIIIASKGRFDRAIARRQRHRDELPHEPTVLKDDFLEFTTDVWEFPPESAMRVNHPAPFPVELPHRLIQLYTFKGDVVLDPFVGAGSTAVAALRSDRRYVGYEIEPDYVTRSRARLESEKSRLAAEGERSREVRTVTAAHPSLVLDPGDFQRRAVEQGRRAKELARELLIACGFSDFKEDFRFRNGVEVNFLATDTKGNSWMIDVSGAFTSNRPGLKRTDTLWKALGKAAVIKSSDKSRPLLLLTTDLPDKGSSGYLALQSTRGVLYHDAVDMFSVEGQQRLRAYASGKNRSKPIGELLGARDQ
jgi:site-specific DNA-methyltransferase (adenine-specific)